MGPLPSPTALYKARRKSEAPGAGAAPAADKELALASQPPHTSRVVRMVALKMHTQLAAAQQASAPTSQLPQHTTAMLAIAWPELDPTHRAATGTSREGIVVGHFCACVGGRGVRCRFLHSDFSRALHSSGPSHTCSLTYTSRSR
jgi:hypothetical protein